MRECASVHLGVCGMNFQNTCVSVYGSMQVCGVVCEYAGVCGSMRECAGLCRSVR